MKKQFRNRPTVTLAVSAFNEAENIQTFLTSVLRQKEEGFSLEKILVISDGSIDETAKRARSVNSSKVEVREYKSRAGKSTRLNEIYSSLKSDILVQTDCDVVFAHKYVIRNLIKPLKRETAIAMCGGNPKPVKGKTFTERAVNNTCEVYIKLRKKVRGGDNILSADGRCLAYRKNLVKKINVPEDMICNDVYTYYCCLLLGYKYKFVPSAVVKFRSPQTLKDQIRQNTRFLASPIRMSKYFPEEIVKKETSLPKNLLVAGMIKQFLKHPVSCSYIFAINRYCHMRSRIVEKRLTAKWKMAVTTKSLS